MRADRAPVVGGEGTTPADRQRAQRVRRRRMVGSLVRAGLGAAFLIVAYALAPLDRRPEGTAGAQLALWILGFLVVMGWQILAVSRSPYPRLRALEAVAISLPLFVLMFAAAYFVSGQVDAGSFNEPLTRFDAVYFTVTIFATVGFGDIVATTEAARALVTLQMLADLVLIGVVAKVLLGAVQRRRRDLDEHSPDRGGGTDSAAPPTTGAQP
jgi:voltage-gated potassium channel